MSEIDVLTTVRVGVAAAALGVAMLVAPAALQSQAAADPEGTDPTPSQESEPSQNPGTPSDPNQGTPNLGKPRLQGTYNSTATYGTAAYTTVMHISSPCGGCDATMTAEGGNGTMTWTGAGWTSTSPNACGGATVHTLTPTAVVAGLVQSATSTMTGACGQDRPAVGQMTRVSD